MPTIDFTNRKSPKELAKLSKPTNNALKQLFINIDTVTIKDHGVYNDKAMSDKVLLTISDQNKIKRFSELLEINEANTGFYCMCAGTYAIELISGSLIKATIGFHHGVSIRYHKWNSDAELAQSDSLLSFLAELGFAEPLQKKIEADRRRDADRIAEREWFDAAPKCFAKYRQQINIIDEEYFPALINDLNTEYPDKQKQIVALLQVFGKTENFWNAYPAYEHAPFDILKNFETIDIIGAYLKSDRNYKTRRGLGRFLCSYEFKKMRKTQLEFIPYEVIEDLEKCFDSIGDKRSINEIFSLRKEKEKKLSSW